MDDLDDVDDVAAFDPSVYLGMPPGTDALIDAVALQMVSAMRQPLAPGDTRRHHFIPKFFQRRFAKDDQLIRVDWTARETAGLRMSPTSRS